MTAKKRPNSLIFNPLPKYTDKVAKRHSILCTSCGQFEKQTNVNKKSKYLIIILVGPFLFSSCDKCPSNTEVTETWENGSPKTEIQWFDRADSTYRQLQYFKDGQLKLEKIFTNGDLEKLTGYHETGEIEAAFIYENGKSIAGSEYFKNGQKMGEVPKELNGEIDGPVKYYYEDGSLRAEGEYKNDKPHGIWRDYDEQGNITSERHFENGKEIK